MRALLAALECAKGDPDANLRAHLLTLDAARQENVDLVVFPEMSLTGSVDAIRHPHDAIELDHRAVKVIVDTTRAATFTVVVGIAERARDELFITQLVASDGELVAIQRKRRLGEDEDGCAIGATAAVVPVADRNVGIIICAESTVDATWDATAAAGAGVVAMCSAPGLDGRRITEAEWRDGFDWWGSAGVADARRHARRLGVWVLMATQAGSTRDEDFPGIAASIAPDGTVADRLPDWRPGTLIVEIPPVAVAAG